MIPFRWIIAICWLAFVVYWLVAAVGVKRNVGQRRWGQHVAVRLGLIVLILLVARIPTLRHLLYGAQIFADGSLVLGVLGALLCVLGMGLALSARRYLGRNWGMPLSQKENPELVIVGPYRFVRHPIYGGIIMAMLGSALAGSVYWVLALLAFSPYFVYGARGEERLLCRQFPQQYPAYRERTWRFVPFLF